MVKEWATVLIGDCLEFKNGLNKGKEFFGSGTPIVNYMDVYKNSGITSDVIKGKVSLSADEIKRYEVRKGDVFFTRTSETPEEVGIAAVMLDHVDDCVFSGFVLRGRPKNDWLVIPYCKYCFSTPEVRKAIISGCTYTTRALTNGKQLSAIEIPLPGKKEQQAIATALSDIDGLISLLTKLIEKKKNIKQGAMQELLTGKKRLEGFSGEWKTIPVGNIGKAYGGLTGKTKADFEHGKSKYIPFMNIMSNPVIDMEFLENVSVAEGEFQNSVKVGDLFFNTSSETPEEVGMCSVLLKEIDNLYLNSFCFGYRINDLSSFSPLYLSYLFRSDVGRKLMFSLAQGATRYNLSKNYFYKIEINMPCIDEQTAIANILSDMDAEIEALEQKLDKYRSIKQGMMQELLTGRIRLV